MQYVQQLMVGILHLLMRDLQCICHSLCKVLKSSAMDAGRGITA